MLLKKKNPPFEDLHETTCTVEFKPTLKNIICVDVRF